jgi:hypothetical protein
MTVTAENATLKHKAADGVGSRLLPLVFVLPFGIVLGIASKKQRRAKRAAVGSFLLALFIGLMSCGGGNGSGGSGGGGGGGGGGSDTYTVTVNASAAGTNTTRALGTITVIVTN